MSREADALTRANSAVHAELEARVVTHRLAVMAMDRDRAWSTWIAFATLLERHIEDENELVQPRHREQCALTPAERGGSPEIVDRDHDKLLEHLRSIRARLGALSDPVVATEWLGLLDREKVLTDLLEHHDLRETNLVYPRLADGLSEEQVATIAARFAASLDSSPER